MADAAEGPFIDMGLIHRLKSLFTPFEPKVVHDDHLGEIKSDRYGNWTGSKQFAPLGRQLEFSFHTGDDPPSPRQVAFFREVETRFPAIWSELRTTLFADLDDFADGTTMEQLFDSLEIDCITFWDVVHEPFKWEIACATPREDHVFNVAMKGFENQGFGMDG